MSFTLANNVKKIMVEFVKQNGENFSVARDAETAFYMWKIARELNHTVRINGIDYGNDWESRVAIEKLFNQTYKLSVNCK